jgi:hypothetical protein
MKGRLLLAVLFVSIVVEGCTVAYSVCYEAGDNLHAHVAR